MSEMSAKHFVYKTKSLEDYRLLDDEKKKQKYLTMLNLGTVLEEAKPYVRAFLLDHQV
jgi:hypothetical protein